MKYHLTLYVICLISILSCQKDENSNTDSNFNVEQLLTDVANTKILPQINELNSEAINLKDKGDLYLQNMSIENLELLKAQWKVTALAYANVYAFNIGPVRSQFLDKSLYFWPTIPNVINGHIDSGTSLSTNEFSNYSPQIKTLSTLEFLLFSDDTNTVNTSFNTKENRGLYLSYTLKDLIMQTLRLVRIWDTNYGNYVTTFMNNSGTGIDNTFNRLYNGLHNLIDTAKVTKVGKPAGLENSTNTNIEGLQAHLSAFSLAVIKRNIESVENVYFNDAGLGISNYVTSITKNDLLNNTISEKFEEIYSTIDSINVPLSEAINSNNPLVTTLHMQLFELKILFAVDVRSILSIIITSTDNDGD
jgi:predicted lipoprotein